MCKNKWAEIHTMYSTARYDIDLRTSYVEFVLSFFRFGDANVKKDILQVKDLVSPIFKGLERDAYQVDIQEILMAVSEVMAYSYQSKPLSL